MSHDNYDDGVERWVNRRDHAVRVTVHKTVRVSRVDDGQLIGQADATVLDVAAKPHEPFDWTAEPFAADVLCGLGILPTFEHLAAPDDTQWFQVIDNHGEVIFSTRPDTAPHTPPDAADPR